MVISILLLLIHAVSFSQKPITESKIDEVIVVFKTHFDIGYTDWAANVREGYANQMVEGALGLIEKSKLLPANEQFRWTVSGWPMKVMLAGSKPEVKKKIEQALKNGNFVVHAMPFTFETEAGELESITRSLSFSSEIYKQADLPLPIDAKQTDVPGHSWVLPTLLTNAGVKFLHIGCNPASKSPDVPLLFWWEGPDKSQLMTMYFDPYYGTSPAPPTDWKYKTWIAIFHTNDNTGAPSWEEFIKAINEVKTQNPGAKIRTGSMADFYTTIMKENPELPVISGDMPDTWIHGYMSMPRELKADHNLGKQIYNLETLNSLSKIWGVESNEQVNIVVDKANESINLFNEHTFGLAMSHGHAGYWAYGNEFEYLRAKGFYEPIEFSWKEKGQHIATAENLVYPVLKREMKKLAASVNVDGSRIVVYNPLPWKRSGLVTIQTSYQLKKALKNVSTGEIITNSKDNNIIQFIAKDVPALGYSTYIPVEEQKPAPNHFLISDEKNATIANQFFSIQFDKNSGAIHSFIDKKSGKEAVSTNPDWNFGQYVHEQFSKEKTDSYAKDYIKGGFSWAYAELGRINLSDEPYKKLSGENAKIMFRKDSISVSAVINYGAEKPLNQKYTMIVTLYDNQPFAEIIWSINGKPANPWPEAGWISFPFNIKNPQFRLGRIGAVVNPATDFIKGSNHDYCFLNSGMAIIDSGNQGFGIMSPDVPGVSLDRPGLWRYTPDFIPKKGNVFFNLYNNQWSTNFTEWVEGSWNTRFYIWRIDEYSNEKSIITPSEEFRNPLLAEFSAGDPGELPASAEGISLSEKGLLITAFKKDKNGDLLRLWEQKGENVSCTISLPPGSNYRSAHLCNLRGEESGDKIAITNNKFKIAIKAYQPVTFILYE